MVADNSLNSVFSEMTLAVAIDSGWFDVDLDQAEQYDWGKGKGCKMFQLEEHDDIGEEFCYFHGERSCSENHRFINICKNNLFSLDNYLNQNLVSCYKNKNQNIFSQFHHDHDSICMEMKVS